MRVRLLNAGVMLAAGVALGGAAWGGPALGDTIAALKQGGALKLGYRVDAPPFSRALSDAELQERKARSGAEVAPAIGFSIDLCQRAAAAVRAATRPDLPVEFVPVTVEDRFESLESGRIDLLCGATTFTLQRQRRFDFSLFTFVTSASLLHRKGKVPRGFYGEVVGVIDKSTSLATLRAQAAQFEPPIKIMPVASHEAGLAALRDGRIDSYFGDRVLLRQFAVDNKDEFSLSRLRLSNEPYALPVRKGDGELLFAVNRALSGSYASEEIFEIFRKWFPGARPDASLGQLYGVMAVPEGSGLD